jgi:hypothetical protein
MRQKLVTIVLVAGGVVLACSEGVGPPPAAPETGVVESRVFRPLAWQPTAGPLRFTAVGAADGDARLDDGVLASPSAGAPILDDYEVSFWAVKGQTSGVQIHWLETSGDTTIAHPYIDFVVPAWALATAPNGDWVGAGDSVLITVTVDTTSMVTQFGPSGLTFKESNPAQLQYWYTGAGGDLNADGVVDQADADIEATLLDLWESPGSSTSWAPVWANHSLSDDWFRAGVSHFSGFAVAY